MNGPQISPRRSISARPRIRTGILLVVAAALLTMSPACGSDPADFMLPDNTLEWISITFGADPPVPVAVVRPANYSDTGRHPVILALPWGSGSPDLVLGMIDSYWGVEALNRGYLVISPAILGSSLETKAAEFIPALFQWMEGNVSFDPDRVVLAGASNGGRGVFFSLVSDPTRFAAIIGMPGSFAGTVGQLTPFAGRHAWLMVGENDTPWRQAAEDAKNALEAAGVETRFDVLPGQDHVLFVPQTELMDWIDQTLSGS